MGGSVSLDLPSNHKIIARAAINEVSPADQVATEIAALQLAEYKRILAYAGRDRQYYSLLLDGLGQKFDAVGAPAHQGPYYSRVYIAYKIGDQKPRTKEWVIHWKNRAAAEADFYGEENEHSWLPELEQRTREAMEPSQIEIVGSGIVEGFSRTAFGKEAADFTSLDDVSGPSSPVMKLPLYVPVDVGYTDETGQTKHQSFWVKYASRSAAVQDNVRSHHDPSWGRLLKNKTLATHPGSTNVWHEQALHGWTKVKPAQIDFESGIVAPSELRERYDV